MKLFYCETLNPRKVCAVARYLKSPVEFVRIDLAKRENRTPEFLAMNPNGKVPVLQDGDKTLWESNAIMCYLSDAAKADLWPHDERQIDVIRWLSWNDVHFTRHASVLYFEYVIKPLFGLPAADVKELEEATKHFRNFAGVLNTHLSDRKFLVGDSLTVADFAVAVTLPYADVAHLPLSDFPAVQRWHERLNELPAWREPFPS
ncbi:glutathione S-transferase [Collimonas sp. OK307]|uniref:glutathione S-transferase family protein n=1 Tax=Collimonas sp. OK307 TaxID=1801620 RepID=UPI0008E11B50|nr:glutathione S-transferase family protein [Collimonas sp. OK307]SFH62740.1 glutathione S-transferase [Collimonas sp. OK307]